MKEILQIFAGFPVVFQPHILLYLLLGFFLGVIFGALPGLTTTLAIVLLLPLTYSMPITNALVMCMGVYMAGLYAGSITAITINIPGAPPNLMTNLEGYALFKKGLGAKALGHVTVASAIGGTIGALLLIFVSPISIRIALLLRTPGKFSLILFAFVVIVLISKDKLKGVIVLAFGMICSTIGMDPMKPVSRFTFGGMPELIEGIEEVTLIIGAFAITELLAQSKFNNEEYKKLTEVANTYKFKRRDFFPPWKDFKELGPLIYLKCAILGYFIGVMPGAGGSMAAFLAYTEAKRSSKHPEKFGTGCLEGIVAPETANNAVCGGALVPMLSLGIPGDGVTAVLLGVFLVYGIIPGPNLLREQMHVLAPMYMALLISAVILLPLSLFLLGPYYIKIVRINRSILYGSIALVSLVGVYAATNDVFPIFMAILIGVLMYVLKEQGYPNVPFIIGVILGPLFEAYLRTSLILSKGNPLIFITQMDSLVFLLLSVVFIIVIPRVNRKSHSLVEH